MGGWLASANIDAIKDDKFTRMVLGAVFIAFSAPFGWFEVIDPWIVYVGMAGAFSMLTGIGFVGFIRKVKDETKSDSDSVDNSDS